MKVPKWWIANGPGQKELFDQVRKNFQNCEPLEEMGVEVYQLARCYYEYFKENIPIAQLGFSSLGELLFHCDDILQVGRAKPVGRLHIFLKRDDGGGRCLEGFEWLESSVLLNVFSCVPDSMTKSSVDVKQDGSNKVRPMNRKLAPSMEFYVPPSRRLKSSDCTTTRSTKIPQSTLNQAGSKVLGLHEQENAISRGLPTANANPIYNSTCIDSQDGWIISWNGVMAKNCVNSAEQPIILVPAKRPAAVEESQKREASSKSSTQNPKSCDIKRKAGQILGFDTHGHVIIRFNGSKNAIKCVLKGSEKLMYTSKIRSPLKVPNYGQGIEAEIEIHQTYHPFFLVPLISITPSTLDFPWNQSNKKDEQLDHKFQASDEQKKIRHFLLQSGYIVFGLTNLTKNSAKYSQ